MADRDRGDRPQPHQVQVHPQQLRGYGGEAGGLKPPQRGPSASQIVAVVALLPVGGTLLCLAGLTLAGSLIGLALTTPLFIICSPVLVPAAAMLSLGVIGFLSSGAFGLTGLSSLSWLLNLFRQKVLSVPDQTDNAKRRLQDTPMLLGQKTKEIGEKIQTTSQEPGK